MSSNALRSLQYRKLIVFSVCLFVAKLNFGQSRLPELIVSNGDTLVTITEKQFDTVLFSFSYLKSLENTSNLTSKQLSRQSAIIDHLNGVLTLERAKVAQKDSIIVNLEDIIKQEKKAMRKEKLKNTFTFIGLGILAGAEAGVITYLLIR